MKWTLALSLFLWTSAQGAAAAELPARLDWSQRVVLSTPVSGVVKEIAAEPGQEIKEGAVLLRLDDRRFKAELQHARADVERLKLVRDEAEREFQRAEELYERTVIAERERQLAEIDLAVAEAQYAAAQAALTRARLDLEDSRLRAPFDGIVIARHVAPGETVANALQATPMITLARQRPMQAVAHVDEDQLGRLQVGQTVEITVQGERLQASIQQLALEAQMVDGAPKFEIKVRFQPSDKRQLRAGQHARITLP